MVDVQITVQALLALAGGLSILGGAGAVIWRMASPAISVSRRVAALERHEKKNIEVLHENIVTNNLLCRAVIALIDNRISGNSIETLNIVKKEMLDHLTGK